MPVGVVSDEEGVEAVLGLRLGPDLEAGLGPIGGLWTALQWASERGHHGVLLLGCDMPLINEALVRTILDWDDHAPAVVPVGPQGPGAPVCVVPIDVYAGGRAQAPFPRPVLTWTGQSRWGGVHR